MKKHEKYIINGKEYNSFDEIPDEFKELLRDDNGDGIPDFVQKDGKIDFAKSDQSVSEITKIQSSSQVLDLSDLPKETRQAVDSILPDGSSSSPSKTPHEFQKNNTPSYFPQDPYQNELRKSSVNAKTFLVALIIGLLTSAGVFFFLNQ